MADDTPTADEATHLAGCWDCRAELAAYRRLARMSAMAPTPMEPLSAWSALAPQLRAEGIIVDAAHTGGGGTGSYVLPIGPRRPFGQAWMLRAAAGFALVLGGVAVGRVTASAGSGTSAAVPVASLPAFQSSDEAIRVLTAAQQQYQQAAAFLAAQDTSSRFVGMNQDAYQTRLAALDEIAAAARAALYRTPQDPMLNQYYLTTLGAREATLRQIGASLPDSRRLERY
jgi:hypothetical protein